MPASSLAELSTQPQQAQTHEPSRRRCPDQPFQLPRSALDRVPPGCVCSRALPCRLQAPPSGALSIREVRLIGLGCVPLADYGLPGTDAFSEPMLPLIPKFDALLMANHGAVCY